MTKQEMIEKLVELGWSENQANNLTTCSHGPLTGPDAALLLASGWKLMVVSVNEIFPNFLESPTGGTKLFVGEEIAAILYTNNRVSFTERFETYSVAEYV